MSHKTERLMAHEIEYCGRVYQNHIIELDTLTGTVNIFRFAKEIPSTTFINGRIKVVVTKIEDINRFRLEYQSY